MTISASYSPDTYAGNGVLDTFAITFAFLSDGDNIKVSIKVDSTGVVTEKTASTHYNVTGSNVVFTGGNIPASGETVIIELNPDYLQSTDYTENDNFPAETHETALDKVTLQNQLNKDLIDRSIKVDSAEDISSATLAVELPDSGTEIVTVTSSGASTSTATALGVVTTPISVANGGTGAATHTADAVLTGDSANAIVSETNITAPSGVLTVGNGATSAGQIDFLEDTDSGSNKTTLKGTDTMGGDRTLTLPDATDTLVGKATTDTLTNKTIDADGTGNVITNIGSSEIKSEIITGQSDTNIATGDFILYSDTDDSGNLKKDTVQGLLDLATVSSVDEVSQSVNQASHGFSVGDWLYLNSSTYTKAIATSAAAAEVIGVVSAVADTNNFTLQTAGLVTGLSGLTAGTVYFLSDSTAGAITATEPADTGEISKPCLIADTTTSGVILQMRGSEVGSGNQDWELISSATASSDSSVDFTGLSSTYFMYKLVIADYLPATDATDILFRTSTNNGSSYDSGASDYAWIWRYHAMTAATNSDDVGDNADSSIQIHNNQSNAANEKADYEILIFNPAGTSYTYIKTHGLLTNASGAPFSVEGGGLRLSAADVDAIRVLSSSGNIASGEFRLYGLRGA